MKISHILDNRPDQISGGEAERACIARALFLRPTILIADEPTNNLDRQNSKNVLNIIHDVWQKLGIVTIVASHDNLVKDYSTKTLSLVEGKVHETA